MDEDIIVWYGNLTCFTKEEWCEMSDENMKLHEILKLNEFKNISLVGAGGKTTFINKITDELRKKKMILVSSTASFIEPDVTAYDFIDYSYGRDYDFKGIKRPGIYIIGITKSQEDLLVGLSVEQVDKLAIDFDNSIIECEYANGRPLKGFRDFEPIIPKTTDLTVGIIDIHSLGILVNSNNIHHLDKFIELTGSKIGSLVTINDLKEVINNEKALFKKAVGKRVLFINKVETEMDKALCEKLTKVIDKKRLNLIIEGSLKDETYHISYENQFHRT